MKAAFLECCTSDKPFFFVRKQKELIAVAVGLGLGEHWAGCMLCILSLLTCSRPGSSTPRLLGLVLNSWCVTADLNAASGQPAQLECAWYMWCAQHNALYFFSDVGLYCLLASLWSTIYSIHLLLLVVDHVCI